MVRRHWIFSGNELRILYYLWIHYPYLVSRDELIEYLWENKLYVDENILSVNLSRMRKRFASIGLTGLIHTVHRQGYCLVLPEDTPHISAIPMHCTTTSCPCR